MKATYIDYKETNSFSPSLIRYLEHDPQLEPFISYPPTLNGFEKLLKNKKTLADRKILIEVLKEQYASILSNNKSSKVEKNIELLAIENTFTITTGHQLNIFTGPLYFIYKIVTAIKLAADLKVKFPETNFVPIYWMATEDHDFEEINHVFLSDKKIVWDFEAKGATGWLETKTIIKAIQEYTGVLGLSSNSEKLANLIKEAYLKHPTLSEATRFLVNGLFKDYGLVILDAGHSKLKKQFSSIVEQDILNQNSFKQISLTKKELEKAGVEIQVNPREINFFYILDNLRERIIYKDGLYKVNDTSIAFDEINLKEEITNHPERFSPNVVMRPLYQEVILPNIAYIGGGAEIIYWLELKNNFDFNKVDFPILILRNSGLLTSEKVELKLKKLGINFTDLFKNSESLKKEWVINHSSHILDLKEEREEFTLIFENIKSRVTQIDSTLGPSTEAVKARLHKAINNLEKKLIKAEKRNFTESLSQIESIKNKLFPNGALQERTENFGLAFVENGDCFISILMEAFKPLDFKFTILS